MARPFPSLTRRLVPAAVVAVVVAVGLGACGGGDGTGAVTTSSTGADQATTSSPPTTAASTSTTGSERTTVVVRYAGGVVDAPNEVEAEVGDEVVILATSDVAEEIHVHTYDLRLDLAPGVAGELSFTAAIPGVHEVELEKVHKQLFRLRVQ